MDMGREGAVKVFFSPIKPDRGKQEQTETKTSRKHQRTKGQQKHQGHHNDSVC